MSVSTKNKRKLGLPIVIAGGLSSLVLAVGMTPTFSAFTASIANTVNTAGTGTLTMQESNSTGTVLCTSDSTTVSNNAATCATINKYGGDLGMTIGESVTTTINIKNTGTLDAASFSLTPGACAQSNNGTVNGTATDLCTKTTVTIVSGSKTIFSGTAQALGTGGSIDLLSKLGTSSVASGATIPVTFTVKLGDTTLGNTYQGLKISQPMTWAFSA